MEDPGEENPYSFFFYYDAAGNRIKRIVGSPYEEPEFRKASSGNTSLKDKLALEQELNPQQALPAEAWFVYPNPFTEQVTLETREWTNASYRIFSATGKLVLEGRLTASVQTFSGENLADGYYYISLYRDLTLVATRKLVKIRK